MPDIEISDCTPHNKLSMHSFDRLFPEGGIEILTDLEKDNPRRYLDANDVPPVVHEALVNIAKNDPAEGFHSAGHISPGTAIGRRFRIFVFDGANPIEFLTFTEFLNNPHGYGREDFWLSNYPFPDYQQSKILRYIHATVIHLVFKSGVMRRIYLYQKIKDKGAEFLDMIEPTPCAGKRFPTDRQNILEFIRIWQMIETEKGTFGILEMTRDVYRKMDIKQKAMSHAGRNSEKIDQWLALVDEGANKVKASACFDLTVERKWKP